MKLISKLILSFDTETKTKLRDNICSLLDEDSESELATEHLVKVKKRDFKAVMKHRVSDSWMVPPTKK